MFPNGPRTCYKKKPPFPTGRNSERTSTRARAVILQCTSFAFRLFSFLLYGLSLVVSVGTLGTHTLVRRPVPVEKNKTASTRRPSHGISSHFVPTAKWFAERKFLEKKKMVRFHSKLVLMFKIVCLNHLFRFLLNDEPRSQIRSRGRMMSLFEKLMF